MWVITLGIMILGAIGLLAQSNSGAQDRLPMAPVTAVTLDLTASTTEPAPGKCATQGNLICRYVPFIVAMRKLERRPALILPGQWQTPDGDALVTECLASYPNTLADKGIPNRELMACMTQPDPRLTDPRVMTVHAYHVNHLHVLHRLHVLHVHRI